ARHPRRGDRPPGGAVLPGRRHQHTPPRTGPRSGHRPGDPHVARHHPRGGEHRGARLAVLLSAALPRGRARPPVHERAAMGVSKPDHPAVGAPAPDALLLDGDGRSVTLSSQWRDEPAVLVFLRYFGCPFCQTQVVKLRDDQRRFLEAGATVVLIGQGTAEHWDGFRDRLHVPFPCLLDSTCSAYREYGLARGSLARIVTP